MSKRNTHEWGFMGNSTKRTSELRDEKGQPIGYKAADLGYCPLCKQWTFFNGYLFKMTHEKYIEMHNLGFIDATECLTKEEIEGAIELEQAAIARREGVGSRYDF